MNVLNNNTTTAADLIVIAENQKKVHEAGREEGLKEAYESLPQAEDNRF